MKKILSAIAVLLMVMCAAAQNPQLLKDVYSGATGSSIQQIVKTSNYTFFNAEDDDADVDAGLYRTDGTTGGTIKLNLSYPTYNSTKAEKLTVLGNKIIFAGDNFANYGEIWSSDGTQDGTIAIERFQPTLTGVKPVMDMAALGNEVLYGVVNSSNRSLLKKTDGTAGGTSVVYDFSSLNRAMDLALFKSINNILYFNVYDLNGSGVDQLWRSDGTTTGTYMVKDFGLDHYVASYYMNAGSFFYIMIVQPGTGNVLWKSDGTSAGTVELKTIGTTGNNNYPAFAAIGNTLYFAGLDGNGKELWKTDGTAAGTVMVSDINQGTASSNPNFFTLLNGNIYFSATTANEGTELWKFDGVNTSLVKDINPGTAGSVPGSLVVSTNTILFRALTTTSGSELWITDGTSANTLQVTDINPGTANAVPNILTPGNPVYFSANNGVNGSEIFKYDNSQGLAGLHKLYVNDNSTSGDIFTTAVGNNANQGTKSSPVATISYAVSIAQAGDTIYVDAGTYTEQVTIDRGITIIGAGKNLTSILKPASTVAPPGPFIEQGVIQTAPNIGDVHIRDLSITSVLGTNVTTIILQSGGSVKNCNLQNGNQGIFFRVDPATNPSSKTAVVENNTIGAEYIGLNFAGTNLTASLINNSITVSHPGFSAGLFVGADFGPIANFTAYGNFISGYVTYGLLFSSFISNINQNSIVGVSGLAIQKNGGNTVSATCNWYGSADAAIVVPKLSSGVTYSPWLSNGTDNDVAFGFQPVAGTCNGRQNKLYVNDALQTGDVFTTAVGNDANSGIPSAPLLTINAALTKAQAGDSIFVDAGTFTLASDLTINKEVIILGTNYLLSPNSASDKKLLNPVRNAESKITNATLILGTNNISLQGLTFDPGVPIAVYFDNINRSNISLIRNRMLMNSANAAVRFVGAGGFLATTASLSSTNITINENRFERYFAGSGFAINASLLKSISITDNSFVVAGTTLRNYTVFNSGANGVNDAVLFSGNIVENASTVITGNRNANLQMTNNMIYNSTNALAMTNSLTESSTVELSNNILDGSGGIVPFINYTRSGGDAVGSSSIFKVENNTISGTAVAGTTILLGSMNVIFNNTVLNPSLIVRGNAISYGGNFSSVQGQFIRPIMLRGNLLNAVVEKNEITLNGTNLQPANPLNPLPVSPAITLYSDNGTASVIPSGAVINILNNKIQGFKHSFIVFDPSNGSNPFVGFGNLAAGITVNVNNNSFTGDSISINNGTTSQSINANCNWYGAPNAATVLTKVSATTVNYIPWLSNGTDNDVATGFQPVGGSCNGTPVVAVITQANNVTCNGAGNGSIDVTISGGSTPYSFAWLKDNVAGFSTLEDLSGLAPGTFQLIVTDANGSIDSVLTSVTEPDVLLAAATGINNICFGALAGSATVATLGGTAPYTYLWNNGETTEDINNLAAGIYSVTVTDANGCIVVSNYEVTQPAQLIAVATGVSTACANSASVTASGGTGAYTYLWSNGASTTTINSISAGTYSVIVTDANGCTANTSVTVTANEAFNPAAQVTDVSCYGGANGVITVTNVNGAAPFQYSINGLNYQSSNVFNNLSAGTYTITVVDANGCTGFVTKTVNQPPVLSVILNTVQSTCFGTNTGLVSVTASGGSGAIGYSWTGSNGFTSSQKNISNLFAGNYSLLITDNNGCTAGVAVVVPSFNAITINSNVTHIGCKGQTNGAIDLTISGGTGSGFSYSWNNGAVTEDLINLAAGNYTVSLTDIGSGCVKSATLTVTQPATAVSLTVSKTNATGCNSLGTITATGSGGTSPYQYKVDNGLYQSSGSFTGLYAGNYTVWIKDANGCTTTKPAAITDNGSDVYESNNSKNQAKLISIGTAINARLALATDIADWFKFTTPAGAASYTVSMSHPSVNYTFNLYAAGNNTAALIPASSNGTKTYILAGNTTYYISVTGALSFYCYQLTVTTPTSVKANTTTETSKLITDEVIAAAFKTHTFPNPHQGNFTMQITSPEDGKARIELFGVNGQKLGEKNVTLQKGNMNTVSFSGIKPGTIFYRVQVGKLVSNGKVIGIN